MELKYCWILQLLSIVLSIEIILCSSKLQSSKVQTTVLPAKNQIKQLLEPTASKIINPSIGNGTITNSTSKV